MCHSVIVRGGRPLLILLHLLLLLLLLLPLYIPVGAWLTDMTENTTTTPPPGQEEGGVSDGLLVGAILGSFFAIIITLAVCYAKKWCCFMVGELIESLVCTSRIHFAVS